MGKKGQLSLKACSHQMWNKMWNEWQKGLFKPRLKQIEFFGLQQTTVCNLYTSYVYIYILKCYISVCRSIGCWMCQTFMMLLIVIIKDQEVVVAVDINYHWKKSFKVVFTVNLHLTTWSHLEMNMKTTKGYCLYVTCTNRKFNNWDSFVVF